MNNRILFSSIVIVILLAASTVPESSHAQLTQKQTKQAETATITCYFSGVPVTTTVTVESAQHLKDLLTSLTLANGRDPQSQETKQLQYDILTYAETQHLLPASMTADQVQSIMQQQGQHPATRHPATTPMPGTDHEFFCNFVTTGDGSAFPIIILPRLIPIIQLPIPRIYVGWKTDDGITSVGGLISRTGFIATGTQKGTALGFWGIGFSIFLPPISAYGMFGYAAYAKVTADNMEQWPPNYAPEISPVYPLDNATNIPISTTKLQFQLQDENKDKMNYSVVTSPDIGVSSGSLKSNGVFDVKVSNLQSSTIYKWTINADDGQETTTRIFSFTTEYLAPQLLDPSPINGANYVSLSRVSIDFTLKDYQNDPIDWTLQTNPDIGSSSGHHVSNGRYSVPIQTDELQYGMEYTWYLNATDGTYWNHQVLHFTTIKDGVNPFLYSGGNGGTIVRYYKENMSTSGQGMNYGDGLRAIISDGQYIYTAGLDHEGTIWQLWPSNLTKRAESSYLGDIFTLEYDGTYLYAAGITESRRVYQFWPSNLTLRQTSIDLGGTVIWDLMYQGDYLYVVGGIDYNYGYLYQLWLSNMTVHQVTTENTGFYWSVQVIGPYVYVGTSCTVDDGVINQYRVSDLVKVDSVHYGGTVFALASDGTYLFAGGHEIQKVYKYWPMNLTKITESANYGGYVGELSCDGTCLYVCGRTADRVWQLNLEDLTKIAMTPNYGSDLEALWTGS
jgi:hypothetical protein